MSNVTNDMSQRQATSGGILKSIGAVATGLVVIIMLSLGTDVVLHATGIYPPWFQPMSQPLWVLALAYRIVYGIAGAYVTAWLAPRRPMVHALVLAAIGLVLSVAGIAANWNAGPEFGPRWFNLALIAISLPCSWLGARLREAQIR
jgi:hypothetical protein